MEAPRRDHIADQLRAQILDGTLPPGTRLREEHLAEELGVSRVPIREAIQRLEGEGWLILTPRRGATVAAPSRSRALELMEVRRMLENMAAQRAALARGGEVSAELEAVVAKGFRVIELGRLKQIPALTERFHALVAVASGNSELVLLLDQIRPRIQWMFAVDIEHRSEGSWFDHEAILGAILDGDPRRAAALMDEHVEKDEAVYRSLFMN